LLRLLQAHDEPWKLKLIALAQKQQFIKIQHMPASEKHFLAVVGFEKLRNKASNAVPALINICDHSPYTETRMQAASALSCIGPPAKAAIPPLLRAAVYDNPADKFAMPLRRSAIAALGQIRAEPSLTVPVIVKVLGDTNLANDVTVRATATEALGQLHAEPELSVPALIKVLRDPDVANVQQAAIQALAMFGTNAKEAVPALFEIAKAKTFLRFDAAIAIRRIDPETAAAREEELEAVFRPPNMR
jgi:HEAT repeat protein